jgi:sugar diacid utilization regulator
MALLRGCINRLEEWRTGYCGSSYALNIHRSTLRYRLGRIRDISGHDLQDVDTRLNLHLATRVFGMIETTDVMQVC